MTDFFESERSTHFNKPAEAPRPTKFAAAQAIVEYVRTHHNSRSDELMELIAEYDRAEAPRHLSEDVTYKARNWRGDACSGTDYLIYVNGSYFTTVSEERTAIQICQWGNRAELRESRQPEKD